MYDIKTEVISASIRGPRDVIEAGLAGTNIVTVPYNVLLSMMKHPLADAGIEKFIKDWKNI